MRLKLDIQVYMDTERIDIVWTVWREEEWEKAEDDKNTCMDEK